VPAIVATVGLFVAITLREPRAASPATAAA
jgi:hypothetical protein